MKSEDENLGEKKSGGMTDIARRVLLTGLGAIFMTEESVRKLLGDLKIPKDAVGYFLDSALKQKDEMLGILANEFSKFLSKIKVHEEMQRVLAGLQLHLDAKLSFDKRHPSPTTTAKIALKRSGHKE